MMGECEVKCDSRRLSGWTAIQALAASLLHDASFCMPSSNLQGYHHQTPNIFNLSSYVLEASWMVQV